MSHLGQEDLNVKKKNMAGAVPGDRVVEVEVHDGVARIFDADGVFPPLE